MAPEARDPAVDALLGRLREARQDQVVILMKLVRMEVAYRQAADLCAALRRGSDLRRQVHPVPDVPSRESLEELFAALRDAVDRIDRSTALLREAGIEA